MKVRCRGFEGTILSVEANYEEYVLCQGTRVEVRSYNIKFVQKTGEIIEIRGASDKEIEFSN